MRIYGIISVYDNNVWKNESGIESVVCKML